MQQLKFASVVLVTTFTFACGSDDDPADPATHGAGSAGSAAVAGSGGMTGGMGGAHSMGGGMQMGGNDSMGGGMAMGGASGAHAGGAAGSAGTPQAPVMKSVGPLEGGLHIVWSNVTPDCEKIELLRNKDGGDFGVAFTLPGVATDQHDSTATGVSTYCYKARCLKGAEKSPESNEKCGKP